MFGCGDASLDAPLALAPSVVQRVFAHTGDRVRRVDGIERDVLDALYAVRQGARVVVLAGLGLVGLAGPLLASLGDSGSPRQGRVGRVHVVPSTAETVQLGVFDAGLANVLEIESGDVVVYPDTWSHFLNRLQPGVSIEEIAQLRREHPGRGPHSIIGPVGVRGAEPGDLLAI